MSIDVNLKITPAEQQLPAVRQSNRYEYYTATRDIFNAACESDCCSWESIATKLALIVLPLVAALETIFAAFIFIANCCCNREIEPLDPKKVPLPPETQEDQEFLNGQPVKNNLPEAPGPQPQLGLVATFSDSMLSMFQVPPTGAKDIEDQLDTTNPLLHLTNLMEDEPTAAPAGAALASSSSRTVNNDAPAQQPTEAPAAPIVAPERVPVVNNQDQTE